MVPHWLINARGSIGTALEETWSVGIKLRPVIGVVPSLPMNPDWLEAAAVAFSAWIQRPASRISQNVRLDELRGYPIGSDGKSLDPVTTIHTMAPVVFGSQSTGRMPNQCSVVITLASNANRRGSRGRFYSPVPAGFTLDIDGYMPESTRDEIRGSAVTLLNELEEIDGGAVGLQLIVPSDSPLNQPDGYFQVTRVGVGRVVDTQRSRRRSMDDSQDFVVFDSNS
jgi:hypothetical protein